MSWSDYAQAFGLLLQPGPLLAIPIGATIGLVFGVIPGLSASTALAIVLPLVLFMDPMTAIALMVAIYAANSWGGAVTAILLNIPGTGGSTATAVEGYQLTKQGRAGEAIAAGRAAAFVGGLFGATVLLLFAPVVARWAVTFGPAEFLALALFGVTIVAAISEKSLIKALISGWVGFLLAAIGQDPAIGFPRFSFGSPQLFSGLNLVWVVVGMFAVSQAFQLVSGRDEMRQYTGDTKVPWSAAWPTIWKHRRIVGTTATTGTLIGMIPGAGATIAAWIGYNQAQRLSKHPERFGHGAIEGVIGPETANDAVDGGSLIPTMTLGIPGSASAAIILGGLVLAGMRPGPQLFNEQAPEAVSVMLLFMASNLFMLVLAVVAMRYIVKVLRFPPAAWPPAIIVLGTFGAYAIQNRMFGAYAALAIGLLAFGMLLRGFALPPALLGFILGPILEDNYVRLMIVSRNDPVDYILGRPIAMVLLAIAVGAIGLDAYQRRTLKRARSIASGEAAPVPDGEDDDRAGANRTS